MTPSDPSAGRSEWYCDADGPLSDWAEGLAWLWQLGPRVSGPADAAVAFAAAEGSEELAASAQAGELGAFVIVAGEPGGAIGAVPARRAVSGVARFEGGTTVEGEFIAFDGGRPAVSSDLGVHAVVDGHRLTIAADVVGGWGRLDQFWVAEAILAFLRERGVPARTLAPIGCIRLDDFPGTAQHQVEDRAHPDRRQARRARKWTRAYARRGAVLNLAVACQALEDGSRVPIDRVWPDSVSEIGAGVRAGAFEPVCHGALHLDTEALAAGEIEYREFAKLEAAEAAERIDLAIGWQTSKMAAPRTFVAPAWAYGPAADGIAAERGLVRWHWPRPGVTLQDGRLHETLIDGLLGLWRLDYSPLTRLAAAGVPPMVITHGANMDQRIPRLPGARSLPSLARLALRRDLLRLAALDGIRWVGAGEMVDALAAHGGSR